MKSSIEFVTSGDQGSLSLRGSFKGLFNKAATALATNEQLYKIMKLLLQKADHRREHLTENFAGVEIITAESPLDAVKKIGDLVADGKINAREAATLAARILDKVKAPDKAKGDIIKAFHSIADIDEGVDEQLKAHIREALEDNVKNVKNGVVNSTASIKILCKGDKADLKISGSGDVFMNAVVKSMFKNKALRGIFYSVVNAFEETAAKNCNCPACRGEAAPFVKPKNKYEA